MYRRIVAAAAAGLLAPGLALAAYTSDEAVEAVKAAEGVKWHCTAYRPGGTETTNVFHFFFSSDQTFKASMVEAIEINGKRYTMSATLGGRFDYDQSKRRVVLSVTELDDFEGDPLPGKLYWETASKYRFELQYIRREMWPPVELTGQELDRNGFVTGNYRFCTAVGVVRR